VLKNIHPITKEAAIEVASNLRKDDYREVVEGHGQRPEDLPPIMIQHESYYYKAPNGKIAAVGGIYGDGKIWMLCTPDVEKYPYTFAKTCKQMINNRTEKILWNIADKRNTTHLKLLQFLGFKFLREVKYGPHNLSFIEFCRVLNY
tara:strand:+ start:792 stop:1229 length:438 start_codon:yes stop_codon:yes gene_type:complete